MLDMARVPDVLKPPLSRLTGEGEAVTESSRRGHFLEHGVKVRI